MKYFMMSTRFNKSSYKDFGLIEENGKYILKEDNSEWMMKNLYDLGWGKENGFCRLPLGNFEFLLNLVLSDRDNEDSYGAAAIIEELYMDALKKYLLNYITSPHSSKEKKRLEQFFNLSKPLNRTMKVGMTFEEIRIEYNDWKLISKYFLK